MRVCSTRRWRKKTSRREVGWQKVQLLKGKWFFGTIAILNGPYSVVGLNLWDGSRQLEAEK